jgi:hypothetical protein
VGGGWERQEWGAGSLVQWVGRGGGGRGPGEGRGWGWACW